MNPSLFEAVDNYCERTGPEFWSEPLNALTNLAFIAAGIWGLVLARRHRAGGFAGLLAWWAIVIGIGSGIFHTFANRLTVWADVVPIALFIFMFVLFTLNRFLGFAWPKTIAIFVAFVAVAGVLTGAVPDWLREASNGSTGYLAAPLGMAFFGAWLAMRGHPAGAYELAGLAVFAVSVTFRIIDPSVCEALPIGTHFLWHALNGLLLGVLLTAAARYGRPQETAADAAGLTRPA